LIYSTAAFIWKTPKTSCVPGKINLKSGASNPRPELVLRKNKFKIRCK